MKRTKFFQVFAMSVAFALGSLAVTPVTAGGDYHQRQVQKQYKHEQRPAQHQRWSKQRHHSAKNYRGDRYRYQGGKNMHHSRNRYDKGYNRGYEDARDRYDDDDDLALALVTGVLLSNMIFY